MTEPARGAEGSLRTRPVHMAVSEAAHVHTGLLPSCSGKASRCGFESFGFKLYLSSAVGAAPPPASPCSRLPAPVLARGAAPAPCACPLLQTPKLRFLIRRAEVPWAGCLDLAATAVQTGWRGCGVAFRRFYRHLTDRSQASCFAV